MQVYVNPFLAATMKVLKTMAFTDAKPGRPYVKEGKNAKGVISAIIDLTGGTKGSLSLTFTKECILSVVNNMLGESYTDINDDIADAISELLNMVSGEARKTLASQGYVFHAGRPCLIQGENHEIEHGVSGTVAVIPFKTENGVFSVEASFESQNYFNEAQKSQELASVKDGNSSLISIELQSFLSNNSTPFKSYLLKPNSQVTRPNFFLIPEYVEATQGNEYCNFTSLEINVCPDTWFASNDLNYFKHQRNTNHPILENENLKNSVIPVLNEMKILGELPKSMYTIGRNVETAVLAYNLAIRTSEALHKYDSNQFQNELENAGVYALKAALLAKLQKVQEREREFLEIATQKYYEVIDLVEGESFFRNAFRLVALGVYLESEVGARDALNRIIKYYQSNSSNFPADSMPRIKRYIQLADKIIKNKDSLGISKNLDKNTYLFSY